MEKQNKKVSRRRRKASVNDDDEEISLTTFLLFTRNLLIKKKLINYGSGSVKSFLRSQSIRICRAVFAITTVGIPTRRVVTVTTELRPINLPTEVVKDGIS